MQIEKYEGMPPSEVLQGILYLHAQLFEKMEPMHQTLEQAGVSLVQVAREEGKILGYDISYAKDDSVWYSWLNGMEEAFEDDGWRSRLVGNVLIHAREQGYQVVQTKLAHEHPEFIDMLQAAGFQVKVELTDERVWLEKKL
jgi:hypothetical protein